MRRTKHILLSGILATTVTAALPSAQAQIQTTGEPAFAQCHHYHQRETTHAARPEIRRRDQGRCGPVETVVAAVGGVVAEDHANILLIMTDDAGFGVPNTFGGVIPAPTMDRIAQSGLRYNRVFSTALCSPTRVDHRAQPSHGSARRDLQQSTGFPGYDSIINKKGDDRPPPFG